nr:hypothetical protein CFP56_18587 [Quercus suber]
MGDGLGGTTNQSKAQTETTHRTTERKTARSDAGEAEEADRMNVSDMETAETEAQITPESRNKGSEINEVIIQNSKLSTCHFNSANFDAQVQEVDVALDSRASNVSSKKTTTPHDSAKNVDPILIATPLDSLNSVDPILIATPLDSLNIVEPKSNIASHDSATNTATLSPSHIAPNQIIQEHATHVTDSLPPPVNKTARTWKRLARDNNMEAAIKQGPSVTKRNREEEMEILPELPSKKLQPTRYIKHHRPDQADSRKKEKCGPHGDGDVDYLVPAESASGAHSGLPKSSGPSASNASPFNVPAKSALHY